MKNFSEIFELQLDRIVEEQSYTCEAENEIGIAQQTVQILINRKS